MEVKENYISNKHIGYHFYFKKVKSLVAQHFSQLNKGINSSPQNKSNLNRPSVKFYNIEEESAISSRTHNDEEENSILHKNSLGKLSKRNSITNFELENAYQIKKHESASMLTNNYEENENIDDRYIPKSNLNFF